jgi:hypothetical protein
LIVQSNNQTSSAIPLHVGFALYRGKTHRGLLLSLVNRHLWLGDASVNGVHKGRV